MDYAEARMMVEPYLVDGEMERIINEGFEMACLDFEHRGIPKKGRMFKRECGWYIEHRVKDAYASVEYFLQLHGDEYEVEPLGRLRVTGLSDEQMKEYVMDVHGSAHWKDYTHRNYLSNMDKQIIKDLEARIRNGNKRKKR